MKDELIGILESIGYPVYLQGSISEGTPYDNHFFTFWNWDTENDEYYDNSEHSCVWEFDVNFYSNDPDLVNTVLESAITLLKQNGWKASGKGHDVASDVATHTGRGMTVFKIEK